jgi:hypothetical protein
MATRTHKSGAGRLRNPGYKVICKPAANISSFAEICPVEIGKNYSQAEKYFAGGKAPIFSCPPDVNFIRQKQREKFHKLFLQTWRTVVK